MKLWAISASDSNAHDGTMYSRCCSYTRSDWAVSEYLHVGHICNSEDEKELCTHPFFRSGEIGSQAH